MSIFTITTRISLSLVALAVFSTVVAPAQAQRGNRGQTGRGRHPPAPVWGPDTIDFINSAPALANGMLIVGSWNHQVQAFDQKTGAFRWKFTTLSPINASPVVGQDGTVYVASRDKNVYALDGKTGKPKWQFATGSVLNTRPLVTADAIYIGTPDKKVIALTKTGKQQWVAATDSAASSPVLGPKNTVYVAANKLYAFDRAGGNKPKWTRDLNLILNQPPAVDAQGVVYVGTQDSQILALDGTTGATLWKFSTGHPLDSRIVVGPNGILYASARRLFAIRTSNGKESWELAGNGSAWSAPAIGQNGTLYVGQNNASLYALDASSGRIKWQFNTDDGLLSFPTVSADGTVYFQTEGNSKVYALSQGNGEVLWNADQDPLPAGASVTASAPARRATAPQPRATAPQARTR